MNDLELVLKFYSGGPRLRRWLKHLWDTSFHHGGALVEMYGTNPCVTDNVAAADKALLVLRDAGWIIQGKKCPTLSQAAFDFDGTRRAEKTGFYASWFGYEPNRQSEDLRRYIEDGTLPSMESA